MFERDYIMRMIKQFGELLAVLARLRNDRKWEEAQTEIEEFMKRNAMPNRLVLRSLSIPDLIELMTFLGNREYEKLWVAAILLREESKLFASQDRTQEAEVCAAKAIELLLFLEANRRELPDELPVEQELQQLLSAWKTIDWPVDATRSLCAFYERTGQYASAENELFHGIERFPNELRDEAIAFYERLLRLPDERLSDGGLPRTEVLEGLEAVKKLENV